MNNYENLPELLDGTKTYVGIQYLEGPTPRNSDNGRWTLAILINGSGAFLRLTKRPSRDFIRKCKRILGKDNKSC